LARGGRFSPPRERDVMAPVVKGKWNKQSGGALNISEITVKVHRGRRSLRVPTSVACPTPTPK
jgi:FixJ family two-component response regulator